MSMNDRGDRALARKKVTKAGAQYGVACPTCNVGPYQPCRARGSRRVTDTHAARLNTAALRAELERVAHENCGCVSVTIP
jgi:hypothetical protein